MPLTEKGNEIMSNMEKEYGSEKKAKEVFYASKNAGTISGVDGSVISGVSGVDSILNWAGGEHKITPGGKGDTSKLPGGTAPITAVKDSGQFGRDAALQLGKPIMPRQVQPAAIKHLSEEVPSSTPGTVGEHPRAEKK